MVVEEEEEVVEVVVEVMVAQEVQSLRSTR
jgi:hypothetical protein